jgi:hypothetical protein
VVEFIISGLEEEGGGMTEGQSDRSDRGQTRGGSFAGSHTLGRGLGQPSIYALLLPSLDQACLPLARHARYADDVLCVDPIATALTASPRDTRTKQTNKYKLTRHTYVQHNKHTHKPHNAA